MLLHAIRRATRRTSGRFQHLQRWNIPGHGQHGIIPAFEYGGPPLVVSHGGETDWHQDRPCRHDPFPGLCQLTEDLGGVTVPNLTAFSGGDHNFLRQHHRVGDAALWYFSSVSPNSGFEPKTSGSFKAILTKGLSGDVVADPARFTRFLGNAAKRIHVDKTLNDAEYAPRRYRSA